MLTQVDMKWDEKWDRDAMVIRGCSNGHSLWLKNFREGSVDALRSIDNTDAGDST